MAYDSLPGGDRIRARGHTQDRADVREMLARGQALGGA
jgi:hypothetical protein